MPSTAGTGLCRGPTAKPTPQKEHAQARDVTCSWFPFAQSKTPSVPTRRMRPSEGRQHVGWGHPSWLHPGGLAHAPGLSTITLSPRSSR